MFDLAVGARCAGCGANGRNTPCSDCRRALARADRSRAAAWPHDGVAKRLVLSAKHGTWRRGGRELVAIARALGRMTVPPVDAVTWVPAARARRARRGGCLPERAARELARELGVRALPMLERIHDDGSQRNRSRAERRRNARDSYAPNASIPLAAGATVLVVDDVRTTGATLAACAHALELAGFIPCTFAITTAREPSPSLRKSRTERGIPAHESTTACRYGGPRRWKGSFDS